MTAVEHDRVAIAIGPGSLKRRNIDRDPRVALSIVDHQDPYITAQLRGRVVAKRTGDDATDVLDVMARCYTGVDYPQPIDVVAYEIEIDQETVSHINL